MEITLDTVSIAVMSFSGNEEMDMISWGKVYKATQEDHKLVKLIDELERGMPESSYDLEKELRLYHQFRHNLHMVDWVVCYKDGWSSPWHSGRVF